MCFCGQLGDIGPVTKKKTERERERKREEGEIYNKSRERERGREQQKDVICGVFTRRCKSWLRLKKCDSKGLFCGDFF
jgi:hypothetical protein